jgi:hypothetical protein
MYGSSIPLMINQYELVQTFLPNKRWRKLILLSIALNKIIKRL